MGGAMSEMTGAGQAVTAAAQVRISAGSLADYLELTKPRVTSLVVITGAFGFYLGSQGRLDLRLLLHTLLGTWLVAAGTSALNQVLERESDARMERTRRRPLRRPPPSTKTTWRPCSLPIPALPRSSSH